MVHGAPIPFPGGTTRCIGLFVFLSPVGTVMIIFQHVRSFPVCWFPFPVYFKANLFSMRDIFSEARAMEGGGNLVWLAGTVM